MQINGMPASMNINLERESEALNTPKTNNVAFCDSSLLAPIIMALLYFKVPLLPSETLEVIRGMWSISGWQARGLGVMGES